MKWRWWPATAALAVTPVIAGPEAASIDRLAWLAGCWIRQAEGTVTEEQWMAPRGGTMLGMGRTVRGERTVEYEHLRIEASGGGLRYVAMPSGQPMAAFPLVELHAGEVLFENRAHDFPQRIRYRLQDDGSLVARIEGERGGQSRSIDIPMARVPCAVDR